MCEACGAKIMDGTEQHASTCCIGEATRGHNRCIETLFQCVKSVDPEAAMETRGIIPTQECLRPADILSAAACRLTAADLVVTSPAVAETAEKAKEAMVARKTDERNEIAGDRTRERIRYEPAVASHFGSLHPALNNWIVALARHAAGGAAGQIRNRLGGLPGAKSGPDEPRHLGARRIRSRPRAANCGL